MTESLCSGPWLQVVEQALQGGVDCVQLREKDSDSRVLLEKAMALVKLCRAHRGLCIINDRPDIALLANADGVHVGQTDLPATDARKLLGAEKLIGVSTHRLDQAQAALADGADYIGVGPIFPSQTKQRDTLAGLAYAAQAASLPIATTAISGIDLSNCEAVARTGVSSIAISAAICRSADPRATAEQLKALFLTARPAAVTR